MSTHLSSTGNSQPTLSSSPANSPTTSPTPTTANTPTPTTPATSPSPTTPTSAASLSNPTTTPSASSGSTTQSSSSTTTTPSITSQAVITSGSVVETVTEVVAPTASPSSSSQNDSTSSNSFFSNTKAVAGVFTVVGLLVIALVLALIINSVKRRRAKKFDRDVAEAAAEAAASSRSPFEDYSYANTGSNGVGGGGGGGGYGYSENSHGTYQMPPLQPNDAYGGSEMSQYDPYSAGAASLAAAAVAVDRSRSRKESEPGTPGIAGVGARGLAREPSKRAPYHAFAGPGPQPPGLQTIQSNGSLRSPRGTNFDVLEAVGLAGTGTATGATHNNNVARRPSEATQNTHLSGRSQFGSMSSSHHPTPLQPGYPVDSYYPQRHDSLSPDPFAAAGYRPPAVPAPMSVSTTTLPNPHDAALSSPSDHNEDSADLESSTALRSEEQRMSYQDDTDYSQTNRVLRVANE